MTSITINFPGKFDSWFSGTGVAQGQVDDTTQQMLKAAYDGSKLRKIGKGYRMVLTFPVDEYAVPLLQEIVRYGEWCVAANADTVADRYADPRERSEARAETKAAIKVQDDARALLKELGA